MSTTIRVGENMSEDLPTLNVALLEDLFRWIENKNGDEFLWNQGDWQLQIDEATLGYWEEELKRLSDASSESLAATAVEKNFCGTALCAAGWGAVQEGYAKANKYDYEVASGEVETINGPRVLDGTWSAAGCAAFGFTNWEGEMFFHASNDLETLRGLATEFAEKRGVEVMI